jgi:hypothetical protein
VVSFRFVLLISGNLWQLEGCESEKRLVKLWWEDGETWRERGENMVANDTAAMYGAYSHSGKFVILDPSTNATLGQSKPAPHPDADISVVRSLQTESRE